MPAHVFTATGEKKGTLALPESLFGAEVNHGLMHQMLVLQQSNRRQSPAHVKTRGEVQGSTKKLYSQKHTGRARRGPVRSPLLRGGGKAFGPRNDRNFTKSMPQQMRHAAVRSSLSLQAKKDAISVLETYPETVKTKEFTLFLKKLPLEHGRRILFVLPGAMRGLSLSARNVPRIKTLDARYLNVEDVLSSRHIIFLQEAIAVAEGIFAAAARSRVKVTPEKSTKIIKHKARHTSKKSSNPQPQPKP